MTLEDRILQAHSNIAYVSMPQQTTTGKWRTKQYHVCMECSQQGRWAEKIKHATTCETGKLLAQDTQFTGEN